MRRGAHAGLLQPLAESAVVCRLANAQRTRREYAGPDGGVIVTVNFGEKPFRVPDGTDLAPMAHRVTGLER